MKKNIICVLLLFVNYFLFSNVTTNILIFKDEYAIRNRPQIPNDEYSVNKIITTFPCETPTEEDLNWFIKVQDEKFFLYYRDKTNLQNMTILQRTVINIINFILLLAHKKNYHKKAM